MVRKPQDLGRAEARVRGLGNVIWGDLADSTLKAILLARVASIGIRVLPLPRAARNTRVTAEVTLFQQVPQGDLYDRLLSEMPRIADAANQFMSEENQRAAFDALVRAIGMHVPPRASDEPNLSVVPPLPEDASAASVREDSGQEQAAAKQRRARKPAAKKSWSRVKDINFRPAGKTSLRDYAIAKCPASNNERNLVAVHYLETVLEISSIEVGHVLAAYSECGWKVPANPDNPDNSLMVTASQKDWLDTSSMKAIRTRLKGQNHIEFDMPAKKATSA